MAENAGQAIGAESDQSFDDLGLPDEEELVADGQVTSFAAVLDFGPFPSKDAAIAAAHEGARNQGFALAISNSGAWGTRLICDRGRSRPQLQEVPARDEVPHDPAIDHRKRPRTTRSRMRDCRFAVEVRQIDGEDGAASWWARTLVGLHSHEPSSHASAHPRNRRLTAEQLAEVRSMMQRATARPKDIYDSLCSTYPGILCSKKDIINVVAAIRREQLDGRTPAQAFIENMQAAGTDPYYEVNENGELTHLFVWSPTSRDMARRFPSVFVADCTYKTNVYGLPLFQIVGVSSVHSSFLAASVFLRHETQVDFEWALQCFRQVLGVHEPLVFVTDKDMALMGALRAVMPDTAHMLCIWHINKNVLSHHKTLTSQFLALGVSEAAAFNFMTDYAALVRATTEQVYEEKLAEMRARGGQVYQATLRYVEAEWLPHREKFVRAWTSRNRHFNNAASSRAEGMNNVVKGALGRRQGSIATVGAALLHVMADEWRVLQQTIASDSIRAPGFATQAQNIILFRMVCMTSVLLLYTKTKRV